MADDKIKFVHEDGATIIAESKAYLESLLGRQIAPADVEMLLINGLAYREMLVRSGLNEAARQNMVSFSRGAALEYLGELVGVTRLPASSALCSIEFALVPGHTGVVIPQGLRVQSTDGKIIFQTTEEKVCAVGVLTATVTAEATVAGSLGNGYIANRINIILDPLAFVSTAQNIDETKSGADEETDDALRERIKLAPASFSVAGPNDAYKFFAKSAHPTIVDVAVKGHTPEPGDVSIYPLIVGGNLPSAEILDAVQAICNAEKIRPLNDTVFTLAPTVTNYAIVVDVTLLTTAVQASTKAAIEKALNDYKESRINRLGLDVVKSKLSSLCMIEKVYNAVVTSPAADIEASPEQYTNCTGITVNIIGTHDE